MARVLQVGRKQHANRRQEATVSQLVAGRWPVSIFVVIAGVGADSRVRGLNLPTLIHRQHDLVHLLVFLNLCLQTQCGINFFIPWGPNTSLIQILCHFEKRGAMLECEIAVPGGPLRH